MSDSRKYPKHKPEYFHPKLPVISNKRKLFYYIFISVMSLWFILFVFVIACSTKKIEIPDWVKIAGAGFIVVCFFGVPLFKSAKAHVVIGSIYFSPAKIIRTLNSEKTELSPKEISEIIFTYKGYEGEDYTMPGRTRGAATAFETGRGNIIKIISRTHNSESELFIETMAEANLLRGMLVKYFEAGVSIETNDEELLGRIKSPIFS